MNMRRLFSYVLLACVCLSVLFSSSHIAYAMEVEYGDNPTDTLNLDDDDYTNDSLKINQYFYVNGRYDFVTKSEPFNNSSGGTMGSIMDLNVMYYAPNMELGERVVIKFINNSKMFSKGSKLKVTLTNVENSVYVYNGSSLVKKCYFDVTKLSAFYVQFFDKNGSVTETRITNYSVVDVGLGKYNVEFTIDSLPFDTYGVGYFISHYMSAYTGYESIYSSNSSYVFDRNGGFTTSVLDFEETPYSETNGLLATVIQWLTSIRDNIVNLPSVIINGVKGFFDNVVKAITNMVTALQYKLQAVLDGITNALVTLGNFIIDGIKGLFVPSQEDITDMKDDWETLLATRFGALYEVVQLCIDYANSFNSTASVSLANGGSSTITIPVVSVPLGEVSFDFGGWEVDLIPSGFEFLIDTLKLMVSICATILFVNGLRNKFERLLER